MKIGDLVLVTRKGADGTVYKRFNGVVKAVDGLARACVVQPKGKDYGVRVANRDIQVVTNTPPRADGQLLSKLSKR